VPADTPTAIAPTYTSTPGSIIGGLQFSDLTLDRTAELLMPTDTSQIIAIFDRGATISTANLAGYDYVLISVAEGDLGKHAIYATISLRGGINLLSPTPGPEATNKVIGSRPAGRQGDVVAPIYKYVSTSGHIVTVIVRGILRYR
jgi:hypothetical protein